VSAPTSGTSGRRAFSVAVFCRNGGEVLLVRHRRLGTWLPVGGEIEPGETPLEAARRELSEETGLQGEFPPGLGVDGTPPGLIGYEEHLAGSKGLHMNFAFVADVASRELAPCDEWSAARWVASGDAVECPLNVKELVEIALRAPAAHASRAETLTP
jgi:8-oxo-dGTP diphosphatase